MPVPLSGQQRHVLTALDMIRDGRDDVYIASKLKKTYSYLYESEIQEAIKDARNAYILSNGLNEAGPDAVIADHSATESKQSFNVVSAVARWIDRKGREQHRTIRVMIPKGKTKGEADAIIKREIAAMLSGKGMYGGKIAEEPDSV